MCHRSSAERVLGAVAEAFGTGHVAVDDDLDDAAPDACCISC